MKIALLGYGKMGHAIEDIALEKGHDIVLRITDQNLHELNENSIKKADVAIEFSSPQSAVSNILFCLSNSVPVVCGTTGWLSQIKNIEEKCANEGGTFLYASNFSIGVNIFFELNKKLASLMKGRTDYAIQLEEIHHTQKKDAPSGTAITLAEQVIEASSQKTKWINEASENKRDVSIISKRIDEIPGTHSVKYFSPIDDIEIIHTAHNRKGFAHGALLAAEFISDKTGIFSMKDVLGF